MSKYILLDRYTLSVLHIYERKHLSRSLSSISQIHERDSLLGTMLYSDTLNSLSTDMYM